MNRERISGLSGFSVFTDMVVVLIAFFLAYALVNSVKQFLPGAYQVRQLYELGHYGWWLFIDLVTTLVLLYLFGFYTHNRIISYFDILLNVSKAVVVGFVLLIMVLFVLRVQDISRLLIGTYAIAKFLLLLNFKALVKAVIGKMREHGYDHIKTIVLGSGERAAAFVEKLLVSPDLGYELVGVLTDRDRGEPDAAGVPILGRVSELRAVLNTTSVDEVFYAMSIDSEVDINDLVFACEEVGVRFSVLADWFRPSIARTSIRSLGETPVLTFSTTPSQVGQLLAKGVMDRVVAFVALVILSPLMLAISVAIKVSGSGAVLFHQVRSGLNGRLFKMYKFRTMVENAEDLKKDLADQNEMSGPVFKMKDDPRVTHLGRWLRRTSLDELPQLFNVLIGDMSLVGPRPPVPEEVENYERWQRRRLSMKPGLTCFWQIAGRNEIDFSQWMVLDLKYIDNWSLKLDIIIMLKTIPVVLLGRGAR
ncbi:MAG: sugar transferase [Candidatus Lernaella stagnicola]|nr:sugar transferase [Candidatus Lernaella stagnicola]